jgi:hypothetical protein
MIQMHSESICINRALVLLCVLEIRLDNKGRSVIVAIQ